MMVPQWFLSSAVDRFHRGGAPYPTGEVLAITAIASPSLHHLSIDDVPYFTIKSPIYTINTNPFIPFYTLKNPPFKAPAHVLGCGEEVEVVRADPETGGRRRVGREVRPLAAVVAAWRWRCSAEPLKWSTWDLGNDNRSI